MGCSFISGVQSALGKIANNPIVNTVMQFTPIAPIYDAANAAYQASQGNIAGAIASGLGAMTVPSGGLSLPSFSDVGSSLSNFTSNLTGSGGAAGAEATATQLNDAVQAYNSAGMDGIGLVSKATGLDAAALTSAIDPANLAANTGQLYQLAGSTGTGTLSTASNIAGLTKQLGLTGQGALNYLSTQAQANAVKSAAQTQADAATKAGQQQLAIYNQQRADQAPWTAAGTTALGQLSAETQAGGSLVKPFSTADMKNVMPAFTFANDQSQVAMQNQLRAQGQTGNNVVQGAGTLAEGLASQYEGQAFNQYQATQNAEANKLQSLANIGQTSVGTTNQNLGSLGTAQANATTGAANSLAQGTIGAAGYNAQGLAGLGNTLAQLLSPPAVAA